MDITLIKDKPVGKVGSFEQEELLSIRDAIAILQRHRKLILVCVVASIMCGALYIIFSAPRYTTSVSLLIDPRQNNRLPQMLSEGVSFQENLIIDSQIEVIKSSRLMDKVAQKAGVYDSIESGSLGPIARLKAMIFGSPESAAADSMTYAKQRRLSAFMSGVSVARVRNTYVIAISYTSGNPQQAAKIANLIAGVLVADTRRELIESGRCTRQEPMRQARATEVAVNKRDARAGFRQMLGKEARRNRFAFARPCRNERDYFPLTRVQPLTIELGGQLHVTHNLGDDARLLFQHLGHFCKTCLIKFTRRQLRNAEFFR